MRLQDLLDLEAQLARDRDADPAALDARDRALVRAAPEEAARGRRGALLSRWLERLREAEPDRLHPGRAVTGALRAVRAVLVLLGLGLGWGAAAAVLSFTGGHPVNVWDALLLLVGVQVVLLVVLLLAFVLPLATLGAPALGPVQGALSALYPRVARLAAGRRSGAAWASLWRGLRSRRSLYHRLEPWLLLSLTQAFGVAFNVGALLACLRAVTFSDVAFGWSTTLVDLDAARFHALMRAVAAPWGWLWPAAVPSEALVEATRYSRLAAAYAQAGPGRTAHPELVGGWWPFLVAALVTYGLLPRLALLILAHARGAWLLAKLPLDDAAVTRVLSRLTEPHVVIRPAAAEAPGQLAPRRSALALAANPGGPGAAVLLWRDVPGGPALAAAAAAQVGCAPGPVLEAGGRDEPEGTDWGAAIGAAAPVLVVAEAFEAPDRAVRRLLVELRRALGQRPLAVLLVEGGPWPRMPEPAAVQIWRDELAALEDPYLAVEPAILADGAAAAPAGELR